MDFLNLITSIVANGIFFCLGLIVKGIPLTIEKHKFKMFFGNYSTSNSIRIVYGMLEKRLNKRATRSGKEVTEPFYIKGRKLRIGAPQKIMTEETIRSSSYIFGLLSRLNAKNIPILTDEEAIKDLNKTYIAIGGPMANELSDFVLSSKNNHYLSFDIKKRKKGNFNVVESVKIVSKVDGKEFNPSDDVDYGIILKLKNIGFPEHTLIVCAGIRARGTSGAAWYLSHHWKELYNEFLERDFGLVVKVSIDSDTSAQRVYSRVSRST